MLLALFKSARRISRGWQRISEQGIRGLATRCVATFEALVPELTHGGAGRAARVKGAGGKLTGKVILAADEPVKCMTLVRPKPAAAKKTSSDVENPGFNPTKL
jgi:hypothetical protein